MANVWDMQGIHACTCVYAQGRIMCVSVCVGDFHSAARCGSRFLALNLYTLLFVKDSRSGPPSNCLSPSSMRGPTWNIPTLGGKISHHFGVHTFASCFLCTSLFCLLRFVAGWGRYRGLGRRDGNRDRGRDWFGRASVLSGMVDSAWLTS